MKTVLITGGGRGIGAASAKYFSQKDWRVVINYNQSKEAAENLAKELGATAVYADISDPKSVCDMSNHLAAVGIHINSIVNNAGIAQDKPFLDISNEDWQQMFDVNVKGTFLVTKTFLPDMIKNHSGSIVNVSSIWGETGASCEVHYSAAKAALVGMTKALAKEMAPSNIRVNCVAPGIIDTDMNSHYCAEDLSSVIEEIPLMRTGTAEEIAKVVEFLASEKSSYITGQIIGANGGWYI